MSENLSDLSALARSVSVIYAERFGIDRDATWYLGKLSEELGELSAAYFNLVGQGRGAGTREELEDEVADLLAFVLLFADWQGIDPAAAMRRKWGKYAEPKDDG